jgi:hypothetical protein
MGDEALLEEHKDHHDRVLGHPDGVESHVVGDWDAELRRRFEVDLFVPHGHEENYLQLLGYLE